MFVEEFLSPVWARVFYRTEGGSNGEGGTGEGGTGTQVPPTTTQESEEESTGEATETEGDTTVTLSKAENDALRREVADSRKAQKKAETEARKRSEEEARKNGEWQKLADDKAAEADAAQRELDAYKSAERVSKVAKRLGFKDPADAHLYLSEDEREDESTIESTLTRMKAAKPYLFEEQRRSGGEVTPTPQTIVEADESGPGNGGWLGGPMKLGAVKRKND